MVRTKLQCTPHGIPLRHVSGLKAACLWLALLLFPVYAEAHFDLPPTAPPAEFGNLLINRTSTQKGVKPAGFSHWRHRMKYRCKVCHTELEFNLKVNTTEITEAANLKGKYCGACHDGKIAFGHTKEHCDKCHNGNIRSGSDKFATSFPATRFPRTKFGNGLDWDAAFRRRTLAPEPFLKTKSSSMPFDKELSLESAWGVGQIPPAVFSHRIHNIWLECSSCHPDPFNIKKKGTIHFSMDYLLKGEFCGVCHMNVAFPLNDCQRCHPKMDMSRW